MELSWDICIGNNLCPLMLLMTTAAATKTTSMGNKLLSRNRRDEKGREGMRKRNRLETEIKTTRELCQLAEH